MFGVIKVDIVVMYSAADHLLCIIHSLLARDWKLFVELFRGSFASYCLSDAVHCGAQG